MPRNRTPEPRRAQMPPTRSTTRSSLTCSRQENPRWVRWSSARLARDCSSAPSGVRWRFPCLAHRRARPWRARNQRRAQRSAGMNDWSQAPRLQLQTATCNVESQFKVERQRSKASSTFAPHVPVCPLSYSTLWLRKRAWNPFLCLLQTPSCRCPSWCRPLRHSPWCRCRLSFLCRRSSVSVPEWPPPDAPA